MGSFNVACALSGKDIGGGDEAVLILMTKLSGTRQLGIYSWDDWAPIPMMFEGTYNSYGSMDDMKIFQSNTNVDEKILKTLQSWVVEDFKNICTVGDFSGKAEDYQDLSQFMDARDWSFKIKAKNLAMVEGMLQMMKEQPKTKESILTLFKDFDINSVEEAEKFVEQKKNVQAQLPIQLMMFKKDVFMKFLNEYGHSKNEEDYTTVLQKMRNGETLERPESLKSAIDVINGNGNYAGGNRPAYSWAALLGNSLTNIAKKGKEKTQEDLDELTQCIEAVQDISKSHALDLSLVNNFYSTLGMIWRPSMTVSEDIRSYGANEALEFQKEMLNFVTEKPKKKIKP
jgi:hypothetical protein